MCGVAGAVVGSGTGDVDDEVEVEEGPMDSDQCLTIIETSVACQV